MGLTTLTFVLRYETKPHQQNPTRKLPAGCVVCDDEGGVAPPTKRPVGQPFSCGPICSD